MPVTHTGMFHTEHGMFYNQTGRFVRDSTDRGADPITQLQSLYETPCRVYLRDLQQDRGIICARERGSFEAGYLYPTRTDPRSDESSQGRRRKTRKTESTNTQERLQVPYTETVAIISPSMNELRGLFGRLPNGPYVVDRWLSLHNSTYLQLSFHALSARHPPPEGYRTRLPSWDGSPTSSDQVMLGGIPNSFLETGNAWSMGRIQADLVLLGGLPPQVLATPTSMPVMTFAFISLYPPISSSDTSYYLPPDDNGDPPDEEEDEEEEEDKDKDKDGDGDGDEDEDGEGEEDGDDDGDDDGDEDGDGDEDDTADKKEDSDIMQLAISMDQVEFPTE